MIRKYKERKKRPIGPRRRRREATGYEGGLDSVLGPTNARARLRSGFIYTSRPKSAFTATIQRSRNPQPPNPTSQLLVACSTGSKASVVAFTGMEFSLKRCTGKNMEGINGKQEAVTGDEVCSLQICPCKRKEPTAGHLHHIKEGVKEGTVEPDSDAVFSDEIEEQAISDVKVAAAARKGAQVSCFSEVGQSANAKVEFGKTTGDEDEDEDEVGFTCPYYSEDEFTRPYYSEDEKVNEEEEDYDGETDIELVWAKANADYNKFVKRLLANVKDDMFKDYTPEDFLDSEDLEGS
jgi:NACalpha-BTF3-like transcription factor